MARPKSLVHTDDARPYSTPLAQRSASSSSVNRWTVMTGPKISFWIASSSWRSPSTTVGSTKKPSPSADTRQPPASTFAWSGSR